MHVDFRYPSADEVSLASLEVVAVPETRSPTQVLHDVSFSIGPGQMVALVGPSGAGKTTITHLLARLYDVNGGRGRCRRRRRARGAAGVAARAWSATSPRTRTCSTTRSARTCCYARPEASDDELAEALRSAQIWDLVASLPDGLDTVVGDRGYRLSGGERQRLAIARLLLKAPRILVLDEATAHLDSESEVAVQRALDLALEGRTSLVIAHRLSTVRDADQIVVLDGGRVVEPARTPSCLLAAASTATSTAPSSPRTQPRSPSAEPRRHATRRCCFPK